MKRTRRVIVNADDLGLSTETNRGIFEAHENGIVTSASLMVRRAATPEAIQTAARFPRLSIGLHIDLGEWSYRDGEWRELYQVVALDDLDAVEREIRAQIELFRQLTRRNPTHLDSHQNAHKKRALHAIFARVAHELDVPLRNADPWVKFCGEFYGRGKEEPFPEGITVENLRRIIRSLPRGITEICCHPGLDQKLASDYSAERITELAVLCAPEVRAELEERNIRLISYAALPDRSAQRSVIISNGMVKSGSTLLTQYMIAMLKRASPNNGQKALLRATRTGQLTGRGYFLPRLDERGLVLLQQIASQEGPVVVKIHLDKRPLLAEALRSGRIKMTFTHRDPRDAILSGIDHCIRSKGTLFPDYTSVENALGRAKSWAQMACNWISSGLPHVVSYADLISDPMAELARLASYLGFDVPSEMLEGIVARERAARRYGKHQFNRGELLRYPKEMSDRDQALCRERLGGLLDALGYSD